MDNSLTVFVSGVYDNLIDKSTYNETFISGWALNPNNIGMLNNAINSCFSGVRLTGESGQTTGYAFSPDMCSTEMSIYSMFFDNYFWNNTAKTAVSGAGAYASSQWTSIQEGDSKITRKSPAESAKIYLELAKSSKEDLEKALRFYKINNAIPQQVYGADALAYYNVLYPEAYNNWYFRYRIYE